MTTLRPGEAVDDAIQPRPRQSQTSPLSFTQERLWFLNQLNPGDAAYHIAFTKRLLGPLAPEALERALAEIPARHEILRTRFPSQDDPPVQLVALHARVRLNRLDLR